MPIPFDPPELPIPEAGLLLPPEAGLLLFAVRIRGGRDGFTCTLSDAPVTLVTLAGSPTTSVGRARIAPTTESSLVWQARRNPTEPSTVPQTRRKPTDLPYSQTIPLNRAAPTSPAPDLVIRRDAAGLYTVSAGMLPTGGPTGLLLAGDRAAFFLAVRPGASFKTTISVPLGGDLHAVYVDGTPEFFSSRSPVARFRA